MQYGEPTGPPILTTKDAVEKEAFFEEPQYSMPLEDIESNHFISFQSYVTIILIFFSRCFGQFRETG